MDGVNINLPGINHYENDCVKHMRQGYKDYQTNKIIHLTCNAFSTDPKNTSCLSVLLIYGA